MTDLASLSAREVIDSLGLEFLDGEGVWIKLLWRTDHGNAIYGLLTSEDFSALHMLDEDEMWVHVAGAPVDMLVLHSDGSHSDHILGTDLDLGHEPAVRVPAKAWQGSRTQGDWSLVVCSLAPPFSGFTLAGDDTDLDPWTDVEVRARGLIRGTVSR
jgi:predicted cupin superfamily sugar epimerase